uniref:ATP synthase CF1 subunit delta n=1 Tax=Olisthodiscus luteus TaxID=83000 RepID=A0A7U0QGB6_OLILU|nr:ATP synthase CF1 subunit delta [Olisthodiscus luteus]QQW50515.1 ATP synthase CF1 subunit delta [Olisthodiscus luteus]
MIEKLISSKIAKPYAESFFSLAKKENKFRVLTPNAILLTDILSVDTSTSIKTFFKNPIISAEQKLKFVEQVFAKYLDKTTINLISTLVVRKRAQYLKEVMEKYITYIYKEYSIQIVDIYSANKISPEEEQLIIDQLQKITSRKNFKVNVYIDKDLIGGFKIEMNSQSIDLTVKSQIKKLATILTSGSSF